MKLERPIVFLDIESTGLDTAVDRIVSLAMVKLSPTPLKTQHISSELSFFFNPGCKMTEENIAIHGITNEMVAGQPPFEAEAQRILKFLEGCDLAGFNLTNFDVPILWEEFYRTGVEWDLVGVDIVDAGALFKRFEPRDLAAAVKFYCGREHAEAHDAMADTQATVDVLVGQLARYPDLSGADVQTLAKLSNLAKDGSERLDLAGIVIRDKDGIARYTHKKVRGVAVKDDPGYAGWILRNNFPQQTKMVLEKLLAELQNGGQEEMF